MSGKGSWEVDSNSLVFFFISSFSFDYSGSNGKWSITKTVVCKETMVCNNSSVGNQWGNSSVDSADLTADGIAWYSHMWEMCRYGNDITNLLIFNCRGNIVHY